MYLVPASQVSSEECTGTIRKNIHCKFSFSGISNGWYFKQCLIHSIICYIFHTADLKCIECLHAIFVLYENICISHGLGLVLVD